MIQHLLQMQLGLQGWSQHAQEGQWSLSVLLAQNRKAALRKYRSDSFVTTAVSEKQRTVRSNQSCLTHGHRFVFASHAVPKARQNLLAACLCSLVRNRSTFSPFQRTPLYSRCRVPSRLKGSAYSALVTPLAPTLDPSSQVLVQERSGPRGQVSSFLVS